MDQAMAVATQDTAVGGRPGAAPAALPQRLAAMVAHAFGLEGDALRGATRGGAQVALARQSAMYLARVSLGLTLSEAACLFGRDRTTAAHACRVIEDRRDDPRFDAKLAAIERMLSRNPEAWR